MFFRNLRVHQIFGANTEVGKTVCSTALCRTSAQLEEASHYLKPIGTGGHGDDWHVSTFAKKTKTSCLHYFDAPVSPHLAAKQAQKKDANYQPPSDRNVTEGILRVAEGIAHSLLPQETASLYVETAGGVHSPTLSGVSQVDAYRSLRLPTILVASHHLGGISTTLSAYESLLLRGYEIDALICFEESYYENWTYFQKWAVEKNIPLGVLLPPPSVMPDRQADIQSMHEYYDSISLAEGSLRPALGNVVQALQERHAKRLNDADTAPRRTRDAVWWPFVQHSHASKDSHVMLIDSAHKDHFSVHSSSSSDADDSKNPNNANSLVPTFDGSASWWTQCLGHANIDLTLAAAQAAGRYGHVIFPMATHLPALTLAERLLSTVGRGWARRVFFSDNGSTGMEVALKMGLRYFAKRSRESGSDTLQAENKLELGVLGLNGSYHGDTIGAMDASEGGVYSRSVEWYKGRGFWLDPPTIRMENGKPVIRFEGEQWKGMNQPIKFDTLSQIYDVEARLEGRAGAAQEESLARMYIQQIARLVAHAQEALGLRFGSLILEPVVMGAGGMLFVDPLFQRVLVDFAKQSPVLRLPVIYDEVFTGLYRLGRLSGSAFLGVTPDIATYAKILTGGLLPMAVTLASENIFEAFLGEQKQEALLHGHSYTAHPIGCAVANRSLDIAMKLDRDDKHWTDAKKAWLDQEEPQDVEDGAVPVFSLWSKEFVAKVSHLPGVDGAMTLGTVLVIYLQDLTDAGYQSTVSADLLHRLRHPEPSHHRMAIHARPLGNTVYWMSSLNTPAETLRSVESSIWEALNEKTDKR